MTLCVWWEGGWRDSAVPVDWDAGAVDDETIAEQRSCDGRSGSLDLRSELTGRRHETEGIVGPQAKGDYKGVAAVRGNPRLKGIYTKDRRTP